jgi:hypothetical protein
MLENKEGYLLFRCQFFRHLIILFFALVLGCGKVRNTRQTSTDLLKAESQYSIESSCKKSDSHSAIYFEIANLISTIQNSRTTIYGNLFFENNFTFEQPLEVNEIILRKMYSDLLVQYKANNVSATLLSNIQLFINRFEAKKCEANSLAKNRTKDLRPYLYFIHRCENNNQLAECDLNNITTILKEDYKTSLTMLNKLCLSFDRPINCTDKINFLARSKKLNEFTLELLNKFNQEIFEPLFELKRNSPKHLCTSETTDNNQKVTMELKVYNGGYNPYLFKGIIDTISVTWSKADFDLIFTETASSTEADLKIVPIENQISHVFDNDLKTIYLEKSLDDFTAKRIAAHEFGHILGFPDCYIEFFDTNPSTLVYYELSNENKNIMCSAKSGELVLDSYVDQIKTKTCFFK